MSAPTDPAAEDTPVVRGLYRERAHLIAALTTRWPSVLAPAEDLPGWWIAYVHGPAGQMTWHINPADLDLVDHVDRVPVTDPRAAWDQHDTAEKYRRLAAAARSTTTA